MVLPFSDAYYQNFLLIDGRWRCGADTEDKSYDGRARRRCKLRGKRGHMGLAYPFHVPPENSPYKRHKHHRQRLAYGLPESLILRFDAQDSPEKSEPRLGQNFDRLHSSKEGWIRKREWSFL
uniref:Uncharacterized protein n=1 Tax=Rhizophora mucronata TaxID=61149 RepID=A0A2P2NZX1_RHIMU